MHEALESVTSMYLINLAWWYVPVIPALSKEKREDEFKVILIYIVVQGSLGYVSTCLKTESCE